MLTWTLTLKSCSIQCEAAVGWHFAISLAVRATFSQKYWLTVDKVERHTWGEEKIAPHRGFPSLSVRWINRSAVLLVPPFRSHGPRLSRQEFHLVFLRWNTLKDLIFFLWSKTSQPIVHTGNADAPFSRPLQLVSPNGFLLSASSPTSPLLCWNAPLPHSHISLTSLGMLIPTVTGSQSQKASKSRKLMAEVCLSEALCIITPWKDEKIKCVCMCVCECVCLLPFNCFPSNQRGHCQVADLLKAVISHLQSLPRLIHWCVILHLFFPSSFSVNSLPSLMGATSFPLHLCSFLAAWCLSTLSFFFFFLLVPSFPSLDYQTFFSFLFRSSVFPIK